jgi:hypothetical protein
LVSFGWGIIIWCYSDALSFLILFGRIIDASLHTIYIYCVPVGTVHQTVRIASRHTIVRIASRPRTVRIISRLIIRIASRHTAVRIASRPIIIWTTKHLKHKACPPTPHPPTQYHHISPQIIWFLKSFHYTENITYFIFSCQYNENL